MPVLVKRTVVAALAALALALAGCAPAPAAPNAAPPAPTKPAAASPAAATQVAAPAASPVASPSPAAQPTAIRTGNARDVILATTTSTQDSGLLDVLVPMFHQQTSYNVKTIAIGTGAALALGARGEADVLLVHAPSSELQGMQQDNGSARLLVMHNDFIIIGPAQDPAHIKGNPSALDAMKQIAAAGAPFVSRGDNSGTNQFEQGVWQQASITPKGQPWYVESGTGMGQTLIIADQKHAYTLSDRATWLANTGKIDLPILVERDPSLLNVYHVMPVNRAKFPNVAINAAGGQAFADFLVAPATQQVIAEFGKDKYGQPLFVPDAGKSESDVGL
jgi:tungstate transport system substrate-binding protein